MKMKKLKNYGKSLLEMMGSVPQEIIKEISGLSSNVIGKHLSLNDLKRFTVYMEAERERMLKMNLSNLREIGLTNTEFIHQQIEWASSFSAALKIIGREKALNIFKEITEKTYPKLFFNMFPTP